MLIQKIQIKDIKNYTEKEFDFSPGVTAICGVNGAGKTTIIEAIAWALFDHLDYKREDFVRKGARKGSVNVFFLSKLDEREYGVFRDSTGTYYVYDVEYNSRLAQQKQEVIKWLCIQHGVEPNTDLSVLFRTTIGVPQGTFTYDFLQAPSKRKPVFDKILKVEEYFQAADELKELLKLIERKISTIREQIASDDGELKRYDEVETNYNNTVEKLLSTKTQYEDVKMEKDVTEIRLSQLNNIKEKMDNVSRRIQDIKLANAEKLERERNLLEQIDRAKQATNLLITTKKNYLTYLSTSEELKTLEKERQERDKLLLLYKTTEQQLIRLESDIEHIKEALTQIELAKKEANLLSSKIAEQIELETKLKELTRKQAEKEQIESNMTAQENALKDLRQKYSDVSRSIEEAEKHKDDFKEVERLEEEKSLIEKRLNSYNLTLTEIKHKTEQKNTIEANYQRLSKDRKILESRIFDTKKDIDIGLPTIQELKENYQTKSSELAQLKAFIERDEKMQKEIRNGLCPLLSERCLNMKEGQTLENYFQFQLNDQRNRLIETQDSLKIISTQLTQAQAALTKQGVLDTLLNQLERLQKDESNCAKQLLQLKEDLALLESSEQLIDSKRADMVRLQTLQNELVIAREGALKYAQLEPRRIRLLELKDEGTQIRKVFDSNSARHSTLLEALIEVPKLENQLSLLNNPRATLESLNRQIAREKDLNQTLQYKTDQHLKLTNETVDLKSKIETWVDLDSKISNANSLISQTRNDYNAFLTNQALASHLPSLETQKETLLFEISSSKELLEQLEAEYIEVSKKYSHDEHSQKRNQLPLLIHKTAQLESEIKHIETQQNQWSIELERLSEVKRRQVERMSERDKLRELQELADFIRECLRKAGPHITEAYLHTVSLEANQLYREISGNSLVSLRWELDYEIVLEEEGRDRLFHNLSGGEQMAAALSVRLALLKEFSELRFAFFDEPTTNMDEERRRNLAQQIGRIKDFEQLFIITHDDSFEGFTDNIIQLPKTHT
jgi:exonuclease SbcC